MISEGYDNVSLKAFFCNIHLYYSQRRD